MKLNENVLFLFNKDHNLYPTETILIYGRNKFLFKSEMSFKLYNI